MEGRAIVERYSRYQFDETTYEKLCELSKKGNLLKVKKIIDRQQYKSSFGPLTFCPESPRRSPLVLAAQQGHLNLVQYFLIRFADIIDINYGMSITVSSREENKNEHDASALLAATLGSHSEVMKLLISRGADVNRCSLSGCTPLQAASELGNVDALIFLIKNGADVNKLNLLGRNALWIAAGENKLEAMELLLESGANGAQVDIIGHSAMHTAAVKGHNRIVEALLRCGVSPMFAVANPRDKDYAPCPLFLAAVNGRKITVSLFTSRDDCPEACKSDAILLLAMHNILLLGSDAAKTQLELALQIREENNVTVIYPEPLKAFGYCQEIKNRDELRALWGTHEFMSTGLYYQQLLVKQRCIGIREHMSTFKSYLRLAYLFSVAKKYSDAENLMVFSFESIVSQFEQRLYYMQQGAFEETLVFLAKAIDWTVKWNVKFLDYGYLPQFDQYLDVLNRILDLMSAINAVQSFFKISNWRFVTCALRLYSLWLSSIESETDKQRKNERMTACRALGEKFVANHLNIDETTLLHLELVRCDLILSSDYKTLSSQQQDILLIDSLLEWGADAAINTMDVYGSRPIHCVRSPLVFELLISYGAHPDAVNSFGGSAYDAYNLSSDCHTPLSLACYTARKIVAEKFPYSILDLPSSVKDFILLHDKKRTPPMLERGRYHLKDAVYTI